GIKHPFIMGSIPTLQPTRQFSKNEWPAMTYATDLLHDELNMRDFDFDSIKVVEKGRCLLINDSVLLPTWQITFMLNERPYSALISDSGVHELTPKFFDATGTAAVYDKNPSHGVLKTYT